MTTEPQIDVQEEIKKMYKDQGIQNLWTRIRNRMAATVPLGINKDGLLFYGKKDKDLLQVMHRQIAKLTKERYPLVLGAQLKLQETPQCSCQDPGYMGTNGGVKSYHSYMEDGVYYCGYCHGIIPGQGQLGQGKPTFDPTYIPEDKPIEPLVCLYMGHKYCYEYKVARHQKDLCLGTSDPTKFCNGIFLYSEKDPGSGKEFVVTSTTDLELLRAYPHLKPKSL